MIERALTLWQPWADLVMWGGKDVENRGWPAPSSLPHWYVCDRCGDSENPGEVTCTTCGSVDLRPDGPFPFRLWIHAGKQTEPADHPAWTTWMALALSDDVPEDARGAVLGHVTVTGCHHATDCIQLVAEDGRVFEKACSSWAAYGMWHWVIEDPVALDEPVPCRGYQKLWRLPDDVARAVAA